MNGTGAIRTSLQLLLRLCSIQSSLHLLQQNRLLSMMPISSLLPIASPLLKQSFSPSKHIDPASHRSSVLVLRKLAIHLLKLTTMQMNPLHQLHNTARLLRNHLIVNHPLSHLQSHHPVPVPKALSTLSVLCRMLFMHRRSPGTSVHPLNHPLARNPKSLTVLFPQSIIPRTCNRSMSTHSILHSLSLKRSFSHSLRFALNSERQLHRTTHLQRTLDMPLIANAMVRTRDDDVSTTSANECLLGMTKHRMASPKTAKHRQALTVSMPDCRYVTVHVPPSNKAPSPALYTNTCEKSALSPSLQSTRNRLLRVLFINLHLCDHLFPLPPPI